MVSHYDVLLLLGMFFLDGQDFLREILGSLSCDIIETLVYAVQAYILSDVRCGLQLVAVVDI